MITKIMHWVVGATITVLVAISAHEAFVLTSEDRAEFEEGKVAAWITPSGEMDVVFSRGFTINDEGDLDIIRTFTCTAKNGDQSEYTMPPVRRKLAAQYYPPKNRYFKTPMTPTVGDKCQLVVYILWYPRFALHGKLITIADNEFVVQEKRP